MAKATVVIPAYKRCDSAKWVVASLEDYSFPYFGYEAGVSLRITEKWIRTEINKADDGKPAYRIKSRNRIPA